MTSLTHTVTSRGCIEKEKLKIVRDKKLYLALNLSLYYLMHRAILHYTTLLLDLFCTYLQKGLRVHILHFGFLTVQTSAVKSTTA